MPRLSAWFVRAALTYLLAGCALGALMLAQKGIPYFAPIWESFPVHVEFLLVGWLVQLAMGVAFWILPRFSGAAPRGDERLIWAAFVLINGGIFMAAAQTWVSGALMIGRLLQAAALMLFILGSWRRVKPHGV